MVKLKKQRVSFWKKRMLVSQKTGTRLKVVTRFLVGLLLLGGIGIGLARLKYMFVDSEYFMIKEVNIKVYSENGALRNISVKEIADEEIEGKNIFSVDLEGLKERIEIAHSEFKDIVIRRLLPDKLIVQANLRNAVAQVCSDRYYSVDREGVLLPDVRNFPDPGLPIIIGIGINLAKASSSKFTKFEKEKINKGLRLINEMSANEKLSEYKLKVVDMTDPGNISFFIETVNIEIKIGNSDFRNRLAVLKTVFDQLGSDIDSFKYIDLRFEDPIVGPR